MRKTEKERQRTVEKSATRKRRNNTTIAMHGERDKREAKERKKEKWCSDILQLISPTPHLSLSLSLPSLSLSFSTHSHSAGQRGERARGRVRYDFLPLSSSASLKYFPAECLKVPRSLLCLLCTQRDSQSEPNCSSNSTSALAKATSATRATATAARIIAIGEGRRKERGRRRKLRKRKLREESTCVKPFLFLTWQYEKLSLLYAFVRHFSL